MQAGSQTALPLCTSLITSLMNPIWLSQLQSGNHGLLAKFLTSLHVVAAHLELGLVPQLLEAHTLYGEMSNKVASSPSHGLLGVFMGDLLRGRCNGKNFS